MKWILLPMFLSCVHASSLCPADPQAAIQSAHTSDDLRLLLANENVACNELTSAMYDLQRTALVVVDTVVLDASAGPHGDSRALEVTRAADASRHKLWITGGKVTNLVGCGVFKDGGNLTMLDCVADMNKAKRHANDALVTAGAGTCNQGGNLSNMQRCNSQAGIESNDKPEVTAGTLVTCDRPYPLSWPPLERILFGTPSGV